jgi:hypothetical protein
MPEMYGYGRLTDLWDWVLATLTDVIGLNPDSCYFALEADALDSAPGSQIFVLSPGGGSWDQRMFDGAGAQQLCGESMFTITIWVPRQTDQAGHDRDAVGIADARRLDVVQVLANQLPTLVDDTFFTRGPITPRGWSWLKPNRNMVGCEVTFSVQMDELPSPYDL